MMTLDANDTQNISDNHFAGFVVKSLCDEILVENCHFKHSILTVGSLIPFCYYLNFTFALKNE